MHDEQQTALRFVMMTPARFEALKTHAALWAAPALGTLEWPAELEVDALLWVRDELLAPRLGGSAARAWTALRGGYQGQQWPHPRSVGALLASERAEFLRPARELAASPVLDTATLGAALEALLRALGTAAPNEDVLLISR